MSVIDYGQPKQWCRIRTTCLILKCGFYWRHRAWRSRSIRSVSVSKKSIFKRWFRLFAEWWALDLRINCRSIRFFCSLVKMVRLNIRRRWLKELCKLLIANDFVFCESIYWVLSVAMYKAFSPSQGGGTGSNPVGAANEKTYLYSVVVHRRFVRWQRLIDLWIKRWRYFFWVNRSNWRRCCDRQSRLRAVVIAVAKISFRKERVVAM